MPLKKKAKGEGKGKGKGKGKAKGKKGKKKGGNSEKSDKEVVLKEALSSAKIWEARFQAVEASRQEYRASARRLTTENESLQDVVNKTERDTIEVIAFLKREDTDKEAELGDLQVAVKHLKQESRQEKDALSEHFSGQIEQLETVLEEKNNEVHVMQGELKMVKEFRKRRAEMQHQLDQLSLALEEAEHDHKATVTTMEHKFFEEKLRLQKEANRRIADLAEKAHSEAVSNLDERTRQVYRENVKMAEALTLHMESEETLRRSKEQLEMGNRQLVVEKELHQQLVQEKIGQTRHHKRLIRELQDKVAGLEQSLSVVVVEFEQEKRHLQHTHRAQLELASKELVGLQRRTELQTRESNHVKRLARRILEQRAEVEQFFLEALAHVRKEVATNRSQYLRDAQQLYQHRILGAAHGKGKLPLVRTFKPGLESSTNSVYHDMDHAEQWDGLEGQVDISELTWEQKEQVLRLLFSRMNKPPASSQTTLPPLLPAPDNSPSTAVGAGDTVFITQHTNPPENITN